MTEQNSAVAAPQPLVRKSFLVVVLIGLPLVLLACMGLFILVEVPLRLVGGWILFLKRVVPQMTVDPAGLGLGIMALVGFWIGVHVTGRMFGSAVIDSAQPHWRWRWTNSIVVGLLLAFAAGTAFVGIAHQLIWMSGEKLIDRPLIVARVQSKNHLKLIGLATFQYHDEHQSFPAGGTFSAAGQAMHSWQTHLIPYIDPSDRFRSIDYSKPWNHPVNRSVFEQRVGEFEIPGQSPDLIDGLAPSGYAANALIMGAGPALSTKDIRDGVSNTLLAGEVGASQRAWSDPRNWRDPRLGLNQHPDGFGGPFNGGVQFVMADGTVRFISNNIDPQVLEAIATPNGSELVGEH